MRNRIAASAALMLVLAVASAAWFGADRASSAGSDGPNRPAYVLVLPMLSRDNGANTFLLTGHVVAAPTCPVERVPPDPRCAPRPVAGAVIVVTQGNGSEVARVASDGEGAFSLMLAAGSYTLIPQPVAGLLGTPASKVVVIDGPTEVTFTYDTGIR